MGKVKKEEAKEIKKTKSVKEIVKKVVGSALKTDKAKPKSRKLEKIL